jgi:hypothetical protein
MHQSQVTYSIVFWPTNHRRLLQLYRSPAWVRDAVGTNQARAVEAGAMATPVLLVAPQRPPVRGHVDPLPRSRRRLQPPLHLLTGSLAWRPLQPNRCIY